jgi:acetyl esterase/lipase
VPAGQTATIPYCNSVSGNSPLGMDIFEPAAQAARSAPVAIFIHGGETLIGSRIIKDGSLEGMYFDQLRTELLQRGFIVGSIDYGLVPLYNVGEQVRDAKCAVLWI